MKKHIAWIIPRKELFLLCGAKWNSPADIIACTSVDDLLDAETTCSNCDNIRTLIVYDATSGRIDLTEEPPAPRFKLIQGGRT